MYKLYSWKNSYSMTAQVALEEVGADYELLWTTIHIPMDEKDPAFLSANPNGRVPTLLRRPNQRRSTNSRWFRVPWIEPKKAQSRGLRYSDSLSAATAS